MGINEIWDHAWKTLNNEKEGFAIKKVIAALFCLVVTVLVFIYTTDANFLAVIAQLLLFILTVLGLRKMEKNDQLKAEVEKTKSTNENQS